MENLEERIALLTYGPAAFLPVKSEWKSGDGAGNQSDGVVDGGIG